MWVDSYSFFFHHGEQCFPLTGTKNVFSFPVSLSLSLCLHWSPKHTVLRPIIERIRNYGYIYPKLPSSVVSSLVKNPVALNCLLARRQHLPLVISAVTCISLRPFANGKSSAFSWPSEVAVSFRSFPCPLLSVTVVSLRWLRWNPR